MGGSVSSGRNNDDLIDNLLEADYIKSSVIERVFRAVDRAEYFLPEARGNAYKDLAWKNGNLHISAPCIYSEVMEGLCLKPGLSFLNLGSGTGYLSTMVGLVLGTNGVNHGIELHEDVIQYASKKLEDFKRFSGAMDEYDFCEPKFIKGNCLCLTSETTALYDRIYCGAACPKQYEPYMQNLLKVGGFLVMPINDQLLQIKRLDKTMWKTKTLLPVSFATLVMPPDDFQDWIKPIDVEPLSLQVLCRTVVRNILRKNIEREHPPVKRAPPVKAPKKKRALKRLVVPLFDDDSSEEERQVRLGGERNRDAGRAIFRREEDGIFSFFLGIGHRRGSSGDGDRPHSSKKNKDTKTTEEAMDTDSNITEDNSNNSSGGTSAESTSHQVHAVIEHRPNPENNNENNQNQEEEHCLETINEISDVIVECLEVLRRERANMEREEENQNNENEENEQSENKEESSNDELNQSIDQETNQSDSKPSTSTVTKRNSKREKIDSGLGDEIIEAQDSSDDDDDDNMKLDAISSCDEDHTDQTSEKRHKRGIKKNPHVRKFRRIDYRRHHLDTSSDTEEESKQTDNEMKMYLSPFTEHMKAKIQQLPLPPILKRYLNYYRDF